MKKNYVLGNTFIFVNVAFLRLASVLSVCDLLGVGASITIGRVEPVN